MRQVEKRLIVQVQTSALAGNRKICNVRVLARTNGKHGDVSCPVRWCCTYPWQRLQGVIQLHAAVVFAFHVVFAPQIAQFATLFVCDEG